MNFEDLNQTYSRNMGGIRSEGIYIAAHSDILTFPAEPAEGAATETLGKLTGNFVMRPGKRFFEIRATEETGELRYEEIGDRDGMSVKQILDLFHPQMKALLIGWIEKTLNTKVVIIVTSREGVMYVLGSQHIGAQRSAGSGTTGKTSDNRKGSNMLWECYGHGPCRVYQGSVPLTEASGSGS